MRTVNSAAERLRQPNNKARSLVGPSLRFLRTDLFPLLDSLLDCYTFRSCPNFQSITITVKIVYAILTLHNHAFEIQCFNLSKETFAAPANRVSVESKGNVSNQNHPGQVNRMPMTRRNINVRSLECYLYHGKEPGDLDSEFNNLLKSGFFFEFRGYTLLRLTTC